MTRRNPDQRQITVALAQDAAGALDQITRLDRRSVRSAVELALIAYAEALTADDEEVRHAR